MDAQEAWEAALSQLELHLDRGNFETWLRGATLLSVEDEEVFVIGVRNDYAREMLQYRLYRDVRRILSDVWGQHVEMRFEVHTPEPKKSRRSKPVEEMPLFRFMAEQPPAEDPVDVPLYERIKRPRPDAVPETELNPRFTFGRFIVNGGNRIAYEASRAVAEAPGRSYNPLLVYGGVGLGKTHLLQAIAHECQARGLHAIYIPSEAFTNDLIGAIRNKTTAMFREKYRSADVLLVDDIQFIAGKDSTQEEFFHTFNQLYTFNKQIVLASDRHPRELTLLEDRLRSRFEGGLIADVQPLDYESRLAVLHMWASERGVMIPSDVMDTVAERAPNNVRELEGVFNQIMIKAQFARQPLTPENAVHAITRFERPRQHSKRIDPERIIDAVAVHFQLSARDVMGKKRAARVNTARQVAMYLIRDLTDQSLAQIGEHFGGRSHTTVLHGCNKIAEELERDPGLRTTLDQIERTLRG